MRTRGQDIAWDAIHEGMTEEEMAAAIDLAIAECKVDAKAPVSVAAGAEAVKAVLDLSLVGPDTGFKAEDVAKACAKAWGLKYVD